MANITKSIKELLDLQGAMGACIVDYTSGMTLGSEGSGVDLDLAAAGNTEVVKALIRTMESLSIKGDIHDMLITLQNQFHIIRPAVKHTGLFIYLVLNKDKANLALARLKVQSIEDELEV
ncbi:MAG: hypothetical protein ACRBHB_03510 [Arenicella sp.]